MIDGSEPRKTSRNETDPSNHLRQRRSFCSFYESLDDVSWAWDESLWPVPALFHAVVAGERGAPTCAKGGGEPPAPAPRRPHTEGCPTGAGHPPPQDTR